MLSLIGILIESSLQIQKCHVSRGKALDENKNPATRTGFVRFLLLLLLNFFDGSLQILVGRRQEALMCRVLVLRRDHPLP